MEDRLQFWEKIKVYIHQSMQLSGPLGRRRYNGFDVGFSEQDQLELIASDVSKGKSFERRDGFPESFDSRDSG